MSIFKSLQYIYSPSKDFKKDFGFYKDVLGARLVWKFDDFGAQVAAFDFSGKPFVLIADHVKEGGSRLIYEVENLKHAEEELKKRGWEPEGARFGIPDGPCLNFSDPTGNRYAIFEATRPNILEKEFKNLTGR